MANDEFELDGDATTTEKRKPIQKAKYTALFNEFWKAYPRRTAKFNAFKSWQNHVDETDQYMARSVINDVEKRTRMKFWPHDQSKIPMAATFLNQHRWEDEWELELRTREQAKSGFVPKQPDYQPPDDTPQMSPFESSMNRYGLKYIRHSGGMRPEQIKQLVKTKRAVLAELMPVIDEEVERDPSMRGEMHETLIRTFLHRLDLDLNLSIYRNVVRG